MGGEEKNKQRRARRRRMRVVKRGERKKIKPERESRTRVQTGPEEEDTWRALVELSLRALTSLAGVINQRGAQRCARVQGARICFGLQKPDLQGCTRH